MTLHKRTVAKVKAFVKDLPELAHILAGGEGNIHQIKGNDTLVESAVILRFAILINIRRKEAAAAHAGVTVALAVFVDLQFEHHLFAYIIGHHSLCRALCSQLGQVIVRRARVDVILLKHIDELWESRWYPHAVLVLYTEDTLFEDFLDYHCKICLFLLAACLVKIHKYCYKRRLSVCGQQSYHLVLNCLNAPCDLLTQALFGDLIYSFLVSLDTKLFDLFKQLGSYLFTAYLNKRCKVRKAYALPAILV